MVVRRIIALVLMVTLSLVLVVGCAQQTGKTEQGPTASDAGAKKYKIAFSSSDGANPSAAFYTKMHAKYAEEMDVDFTIFDSKGDAQLQAQQINEAVAQGFQGIVVNPNDPEGVVPALKAAKEAGVYVAIFSSELSDENLQYRTFRVAPDDIVAGKTAAKAFIDQFPNGATIVEIGGQSGHAAQIKRHDGFVEGLEGSNIEVLAVQNATTWDTNDCLDIMQNFIVKYGDQIQGVYCHWDGGLTGVIQAEKNANIDPQSIFSVAVDGNKDGFAQVEAGTQAISIMQNYDTMSKKCMEMMIDAIDGKNVDSVYAPEWDIVTKDTINNFTIPEW